MNVIVERDQISGKFALTMQVVTQRMRQTWGGVEISDEFMCRRYEVEQGVQYETDDIVEALIQAMVVQQAFSEAKDVMSKCFDEEQGIDMGVKMFDAIAYEEPILPELF